MSKTDTPKKNRVMYRNPVYVAYILFGVVLYYFGSVFAQAGSGFFETAIFRIVNSLPDFLSPFFFIASIFGTIFFALILSLIALVRSNYMLSLKYFLAGVGTYTAAYFLKLFDARLRPQELFEVSNIREIASSTVGYPSAHVAVATALAIIMYQYVPSKYHRYITWSVVAVAISRMYVGVNLPVDLVGGFAVGLVVGSAVSLLLGRSVVPRISTKEVRAELRAYGFAAKEVKVLSVDARGSSPFIVIDDSGKKYFLKVVNRENFVADWLFKMWRKVIYRRLEDESPHFSPKRQIEHESYVANLALANGIKTPKIVGVFELGVNNWAQMQEMIDGKSLDRVDQKIITDKVLDKIFILVRSLHDARIIHRDLRTANIFIDNHNEPWLIDFGFGEASIKRRKTYRDIVELLASLGVLAGSDRVVKSAIKNLPKEDIEHALSYLNYPSLSSETTRQLKMREELLPEIRAKLAKELKASNIKLARVQRFKFRKSK